MHNMICLCGYDEQGTCFLRRGLLTSCQHTLGEVDDIAEDDPEPLWRPGLAVQWLYLYALQYWLGYGVLILLKDCPIACKSVCLGTVIHIFLNTVVSLG